MEAMAENTAAKLKEIINKNGLNFLKDEPYEVYLELTQNEKSGIKPASLILHALVNNIQNEVRPASDPASLSKMIQERCSFNQEASDYLSEVFLALFTKENEAEWKEMNLAGLRQFLAEEFVCSWKGAAVWKGKGVNMDSHYQAEITLKPCADSIPDQKLAELLKKNPFTTNEAIHQYYEKDLIKELDDIFEDYGTDEEDYPPYAEELNIESWVKYWCQRHGFELISCVGHGESEYE